MTEASAYKGPLRVCVLTSPHGQCLTETWVLHKRGLRCEPADKVKFFDIDVRQFDDFAGLCEHIDRRIDQQCIIYGDLAERFGGKARGVRRLRCRNENDTTGTIVEARHAWLPVEFDEDETPEGIDPVADPEGAAAYVISRLPDEFQEAEYQWQLTAKAGVRDLKTDELVHPGVHMRLIFRLNREITNSEAGRWLGGVPGVNQQIYEPTQLILVAAPQFEGLKNPVPRRSGLKSGSAVAVPDILEAGPPQPDELWHCRHETWATLPNGWNHPVESPEFRRWLIGECVRLGQGAKKAQIDALVEVYAATALYNGPEYQVHLRTAPDAKGGVYIDLADKAGQAVHVSAEGWEIIPRAPVKFYRPPNMKPLPPPLRNEADATLLQMLLNLPNESEFRLLLTACSFALLPGKPYPLIVFEGHAGAAKTSAARIVRNTLDPNEVPVAGMPHGQDLVACAKNNAVIVLDNLSALSAAVQDDLCRLATGGGMGGRKLYTNDGDASFNASRPVIMTGINNLATRGDLADRALPFHLGEIVTRKTDAEIQEGFAYAHPRMFAGLLDIMVVGFRRLDEVQRARRPLERMADFTQWGYAVAPAIGWAEDDFRLAYRATRREAIQTVIESDPVAAGIVEMVHGAEQKGKPWRGFQTSLWKRLAEAAGDAARAPGFPRSPEALGWALKRVIPVLGDRGIRIERSRKRAGMWVTIEP